MSAPLLLDTHILVWAVTEPERMSAAARQIIERAELIYVSAVSAWEIVQLADRGRLALDGDARRWVARAMDVIGAVPFPLTFDIAMEAAQLAYEHRDPADRFLIATARVHDLVLVTADRRIREWPDVNTVG